MLSSPPMGSRNDHISTQRASHGRKALAVLPIHYPKELLTALDLLAVEVWGPPGAPRGDDAGRIQAYVCSVVRNAMAFLCSGGADAVDGVLFPHTCDSIQGLATLAPDFGGWGKASFTFLHPKGPSRHSSRTYLDGEFRSLARRLEAFTGRALDADRLSWAIRLHAEIDRARAALLDARSHLAPGDPEIYGLLRRGEWLWPEEHLSELLDFRARFPAGPRRPGVPVLLSGYVPEPPALLQVLNDAGAYVAADDLAAVGRRVVRRAPDAADPWAERVEQGGAAQ